jgi:hypothetical protein
VRLEKFVDSGDIDPAELSAAAFFDLAEGAEPQMLAQYLVDKVGLAEVEAARLIGEQNARLEATLHELARKLEDGVESRALSNSLVESDWPRELADAVVARTRRDLAALAHTRAGRDQLLAGNRRRFWSGIIWILVGVAFAAAPWLAAQGGGEYTPGLLLFALIFGPILFGVGQIIRGVLLWFGYRAGSRRT